MAGVLDDERLWPLRGVRMGRAGVDLELLEHASAEGALGQHAAHRTANRVLGLGREQVAVGALLQATGVPRVTVDETLLALVGREHDPGRVDDDHVVAGVDMGGEDRLVLAAEDPRHL